VRSKVILTAVVLTVAVGVSTAAASLLAGSSDEPQRLEPEKLEGVTDTASNEVFKGELLGIHFGTQEELTASGVAKLEPCPTTDVTLLYIPGEGSYVPPAPAYLSEGAVLTAVKPGGFADVPNPGTAWCPDTGKVYSSWRYYEFPDPRYLGRAPFLTIGRLIDDEPHTTAPYYAGELEVVELGGQEIIMTKAGPRAEDALGPEGVVVFIPEPTGYIGIHSENMSRREVLKIIESFVPLLKPLDTQEVSGQ